MRCLQTALLICCLCICCVAQPQNAYLKDLDNLYRLLQRTPGYKTQIKGPAKKAYKKLVVQLKQMPPDEAIGFENYYRLSQLLLPIRDNHLDFSQLLESYLYASRFSDTGAVRVYRASATFARHPRSFLPLDSLESSLYNKPDNSIEGIYHYGSFLTAALFRTVNPDSLVGVVLRSALPHWDPGQVAFVLKETSPDHFHAWYAHPVFKSFLLVRNERFLSGILAGGFFHSSLTDASWQKFPDSTDHVNIGKDVPQFQISMLAPDVRYLRLGSFDASDEGLMKSALFFNQIKDSLQTAALVLDLRNNTGGGFKASGKYLKLVLRYARNNKVYILANYRTISNGEQFLLKLKGKKNILLLGAHTQGKIAYGSNYGRRITLPGGRYQLYPTDMKDSKNYLRYENKGVVPDIALSPNLDWLQQALDIIREKQTKKADSQLSAF